MTELEQLRQQMDDVDASIVEALEARMEIAKKIAEYKLEKGMRVLDKSREAEVLISREGMLKNKEFAGAVNALFELLMEISRAYQKTVVQQYKAFDEDQAAVNVAYQGEKGANSEAVLKLYFGSSAHGISCNTFEDVFSIVAFGKAKYGVLPVENSNTGSIVQIYDLLTQYDVSIVGEQQMLIDHNLLGLPGSKLEEITDVYSHEQALLQCAVFLKEHEMTQHPYFNTAVSAKFVAKTNVKSNGAIASSYAAKLYDLEVLAEDISTYADNTTRFIIIAANREDIEDADKASVNFVLEHKSGALSKVLAAFAQRQLNMVKIESRPLENRNFEYVFYVDFEGKNIQENVSDVLEENKNLFVNYKILGAYKKRETIQL